MVPSWALQWDSLNLGMWAAIKLVRPLSLVSLQASVSWALQWGQLYLSCKVMVEIIGEDMSVILVVMPGTQMSETCWWNK